MFSNDIKPSNNLDIMRKKNYFNPNLYFLYDLSKGDDATKEIYANFCVELIM